MNVQITCRHTKVSTGTQDYLKSEIEDLAKYYDKISTVHVVLDSECLQSKTVEINMHVAGQDLSARSRAENYYKAVDEALEKITRQIRKKSEKIKSHKASSVKDSEAVAA